MMQDGIRICFTSWFYYDMSNKVLYRKGICIRTRDCLSSTNVLRRYQIDEYGQALDLFRIIISAVHFNFFASLSRPPTISLK